METFFSTTLSGFIPYINSLVFNDLPKFHQYGTFFAMIFVLTLLANIIRSMRNCWKDSYGISYGIYRGLIIGTTTTLGLALLPVLGMDLSILIQGLIIAGLYVVSYLFTYPAYGAC